MTETLGQGYRRVPYSLSTKFAGQTLGWRRDSSAFAISNLSVDKARVDEKLDNALDLMLREGLVAHLRSSTVWPVG